MCSRRLESTTTSYVNRLLSLEHHADCPDVQDLPQIAVIGSQSSGKSSVLEVSWNTIARVASHLLTCLDLRIWLGGTSCLEVPVS